MSDFSNILIKYSVVTAAPASLQQGELAYSQLSNNLFIGTDSGVPVVIGGADLVNRFGTVEALVSTIESEFNTAKGDIQTLLANLAALESRLDSEDLRLQGEIDAVKATADNLVNNIVPALTGQVGDHEGRLAAAEALLGTGTGGTPTFTDLTITGNLVVSGTTTSVNSEITTLKDPVIHLGESDGAVVDAMDRGVTFKHVDPVSGTEKIGFFGMDATDGNFKFIPDATEVAPNVFEGAVGTIDAKIEKLATARNIALGGEASGSVAFDGSADVQIDVVVSASVEADAESIVRRDVDGVTKFGGVRGVSVNGQAASITGFVINGGTF